MFLLKCNCLRSNHIEEVSHRGRQVSGFDRVLQYIYDVISDYCFTTCIDHKH